MTVRFAMSHLLLGVAMAPAIRSRAGPPLSLEKFTEPTHHPHPSEGARMKLAPIGRAPDPNDLDLEPVIVPVVAYKEDKTEVIAEFPFKPVMPPGAMAALVRNSGPNGELPANIVLMLLNHCVDADSSERWNEFLDSDEHVIFQETLGEVLNALTEVYAKRPTRQRSGSQATGAPAAPTSPAEPPSTE